MNPDQVPNHYADDRYATQREAGFPWLLFGPDLEREYRSSYVQLNAQRIRAAALVGIAAVIGFLIVDNTQGIELESKAADWLLVLVTIPALLVPFFATFRPKAGPYVLRLLLVGVLLIVLSVVAAINLGRAVNPWFPQEGVYLLLMFVYFVSGLTFYQAVFCGVAATAAFVITNAPGAEPQALPYQAYLLLLANVLGPLGHYMLERQSRVGWLLRSELRQRAALDSVTGLLNHRAFTSHLETAWLQAQREVTSVGLMLIDLDHFKRVNDTCGHQFGDEALHHVAQLLKASAQRPLDAAGRCGGDELAAVWFGVDGSWLAKLAQELPQRVDLRCGEAAVPLQLTISGGAVLAWPRPGLSVRDAMKAADELLYEVKRGERGSIRYKVLMPAAPAELEQDAA